MKIEEGRVSENKMRDKRKIFFPTTENIQQCQVLPKRKIGCRIGFSDKDFGKEKGAGSE